MNIGIFGGAFNPVHNGHMHLLGCYFDVLQLDKVILIPTADPPHKSSDGLISGTHRINMLSIASQGDKRIEISDIEFKLTGKSYTYNTLLELKKIYPDDRLFLIIGSDQYLYFQNWYRAGDILDMVTVVTAAREQEEYQALTDFKNSNENMKNTIISTAEAVPVSSSQIRAGIKNGENVSSLLPQGVYKYIMDNNLYV